MFDLRRVPIARVMFPFAGGSLLVRQLEHFTSPGYLLLFCLLIWICLVILFFRQAKRAGIFSVAFGNLAIILFMALGYSTGMATRPKDPRLPVEEMVLIRGEVLEDPYLGNRNWVVEMRLFMVVSGDSSYITGTNLKVYLEMPVDSILPALGETWQMFGQLSAIRNSGNPGEPDYESIMQRKNIWYRFFADSRFQVNRRLEEQPDRRMRPASIRRFISKQWKGDPEEVSLLKAVCLGDRSGLTDDMRQSYATAGGMHLLAVSGLHVGLIWWVLQYSFGWMVRLLRKEIYRVMTIILLLWFYAFVTGFSSSVCRSVTMFSIFTLSGIIDRRTHPVNGILVSAFILILINPGRLLDVGFQLSYAAILGIVTLNSVIRSLLTVKNRILRWIWEASVISLAAQLATMPLVAYYFHQLPTYSLLTNLFAVPLLSGLIALFVISVPFMTIGVFTGVFNTLLMLMGKVMNRSMEIIASIPGARIDHLQLDHWSLYMFLIILILAMYMLNYRITLPRYIFWFLIAALLLWSSWTRYRELHKAELAILHFSGCSLVTFREGYHVDLYFRCGNRSGYTYMNHYIASTWDKRRFKTHTFDISDSAQNQGIITSCNPIAEDLLMVGNDQISGWIISGSYGHDYMDLLAERQGDFILFSGEPPMLNSRDHTRLAQFDLIVDGSNRKWYTRQMELEKVPIHFTRYQGAYLKEW